MKGAFFFIPFLLCAVSTFADAKGGAFVRVIEDFSDLQIGKFPSSFKTYPFQRQKAMKVYLVQGDSEDHYLRAVDRNEAGAPIFRRFDWDANRWPHFSWRWRAHVLPVNGGTGDCACGVYVIFGGFNGKSIKYIWSTNSAIGTLIENDRKKFYTLVKESGPKKAGSWETFKVSIKEDYRKFFGEELHQEPKGFAVLTDGDDTHSPAACDYDDFKISE